MLTNLAKIDQTFSPVVKRLGLKGCIQGQSINPQLRLYQDSRIEVYFSPLGEPLSRNELKKIRVLFIGLTPGLRQTLAAYNEHFSPNKEGRDAISFEGPMRANLIRLMNHLGLPRALGIETTSELFEASFGHLAESTSLLRYPVFVRGKNYSGSPWPSKHPFLKRMIDELLVPVLSETNDSTLVVPLGRRVSGQVSEIAKLLGPTVKKRCLIGFPHTSGAGNGWISEYLKSTEVTQHKAQIKKLFK